MKKQAYSYVRFSTDIQKHGDSKRRQYQKINDYCKQNNLELAGSFEDLGLSGYTAANVRKGELGDLLEQLDEDKKEKEEKEKEKEKEKNNDKSKLNIALLVESHDRLSRQPPLDAMEIVKKILDHGVEIHTLIDNQIFTRESVNNNFSSFYSMIGSMMRAYEESQVKSDRLKAVNKEKRKLLGEKISTSLCPAWMKIVKDKNGNRIKFENKPECAKTISKIYDLCIDNNMGSSSINTYLNEHIDQYPVFTKKTKINTSKVKGWGQSYIKKILSNKAVYGVFIAGYLKNGKQTSTNIETKNYYPKVISQERFDIAQNKISARKNKGVVGRGTQKFKNLFSVIAKCGSCNGSMYYKDPGNSPKSGKTYLKCSNSIAKNNCNCPTWRYEEFEKIFLQEVSELDLTEIFKKPDEKSKKKVLQNELDSIDVKILKLSKEKKRLIEFIRKNDDADILKEFETITDDIKRLENNKVKTKIELDELITSVSSENSEKLVSAIQELGKTGNISEQQVKESRQRLHHMITAIIDKIVVFNEPPLGKNPNPVGSGGFSKMDVSPEFFEKFLKAGLVKQRYIQIYFKNGKYRYILEPA